MQARAAHWPRARRHGAGRLAVLIGVVVCAMAGTAVADSWTVTRKVRTGSMPWSVTVSADGTNLWVSMVGLKDRDNVWRYDAETLEVEAKSSFPGHAVESKLIANDERLLVTNSRKNLLMVLESSTLKVLRRIATDRTPKDFDVDTKKGLVFVANYGAGTLSAIRLDDGRASHVKTGRHARGATLAPSGDEVYVMNFGARSVSVVDTATLEVRARITTCKNPRHAVVIGQNLLVTCYGARHVAIIDRATRKVQRNLLVGKGPKTITLSPDGSFAVTANEKGNSISIIDTRTWQVTTIPLPASKPCGVAIAPSGTQIYVTARGSHQLIELSRKL